MPPTAQMRAALADNLDVILRAGLRQWTRPYDVLVVGAGFAGAVAARLLAEDCGLRVLVIDRRPHIAGNAHDSLDDHGVLCHTYGPHIFHTNSERVWTFLSRFASWRPYEHRVVAEVDGRFVPMPINRRTVNALHSVSLDESEVAAHLAALAEPRDANYTSEDAIVSKVGRDLYERLFRGYTRKQWDLDPAQLHASVCARIPVRTNDDDRYFSDTYQAMPREGYTALFAAILDSPGIEVQVGVAHEDVPSRLRPERTVWTGSIDAFFDHQLGRLPYRSLRFELETRQTPGGRLVQPAGTVNYPNERIPYTRVTEFRHLTGQSAETSTLAYEYPMSDGDPYYPIPRPENRQLYHRYERLAQEQPQILFVGRLARYQYLNMDQVVAAAMVAVARWPAVGRVLATAAASA